MVGWFRKFAEKVSRVAGTPWAFFIAIGLLLAWACFGPWLNFSPQWQLVINSITTIVTFLMVFIIQNTQKPRFQIAAVEA